MTRQGSENEKDDEALEATDEMVAAAILFVQDSCEIQSEVAAANIVRGVWDRMLKNAPSEYREKHLHFDLTD